MTSAPASSGPATAERHILVVCTANQCRSPMAEGLIRAAVDVRGLTGQVRTRSAGTWAIPGVPATDHAVAVMSARGIDIAGHRSAALDPEGIARADLILTMTSSHAEAIAAEFPAARAKVRRMSELAGGSWNIADPVGGTREDYEATADELARLIEAGWAIIVGDATIPATGG